MVEGSKYAKKAKEDIVVRKIYDVIYRSDGMFIRPPIQGGEFMLYKPNMKVEGKFDNKWKSFVFHISKIGCEMPNSFSNHHAVTSGFIHTSKSWRVCVDSSRQIFECIIPKGTYYYKEGNDYASRKIIIKKEIVEDCLVFDVPELCRHYKRL